MELEISCPTWQDSSLKQKLESQIVALYESILEYEAQALCFYQRATIARFLRSIPNLDDPSSLLEEVRRKDEFCKDLDALRRHQELYSLSESHEKKLTEIDKAIKLLSQPAGSSVVTEPASKFVLQFEIIATDNFRPSICEHSLDHYASNE